MEVREKVEFIPLAKNSKVEEEIMERKELVEALIANKETPYDKDDEKNLIAMSEEKFQNVLKFTDCKCKELANNEKKEEVKEEKEKIVVNEEKEVKEEKQLTYAELLASATPEDREFIENGTSMYKEEKTKAVEALLANSRNPFAKEVLETKSLKELKDLATLGNVPVTYEGNSPDSAPKKVDRFERQDNGMGVPKVMSLSQLVRESASK